MRPGAILVNTSRGPLVDLDALRTALAEDRLGGVGLDVLEVEPPSPEDPLLHRDDVIVTPHAAFYSEESLRRAPAQGRRAGHRGAGRARTPPYAVNADAISGNRLGPRPGRRPPARASAPDVHRDPEARFEPLRREHVLDLAARDEPTRPAAARRASRKAGSPRDGVSRGSSWGRTAAPTRSRGRRSSVSRAGRSRPDAGSSRISSSGSGTGRGRAGCAAAHPGCTYRNAARRGARIPRVRAGSPRAARSSVVELLEPGREDRSLPGQHDRSHVQAGRQPLGQDVARVADPRVDRADVRAPEGGAQHARRGRPRADVERPRARGAWSSRRRSGRGGPIVPRDRPGGRPGRARFARRSVPSRLAARPRVPSRSVSRSRSRSSARLTHRRTP